MGKRKFIQLGIAGCGFVSAGLGTTPAWAQAGAPTTAPPAAVAQSPSAQVPAVAPQPIAQPPAPPPQNFPLPVNPALHYPPAPAYPPAPGSPPVQGYPPAPGYAPAQAYPAAPGYPAAPAYPSAPGYPPAQAVAPAQTYPEAPPPPPISLQPAPAPVAPPQALTTPISVVSSAPAAPTTDAPWYDLLKVSAFVDGNFGMNWSFPKPQEGRNRFRAFDANNGFALSWAGVNLSLGGPEVAGTLDLRFGPSAARLAGSDESAHGLQYVKQAYATWRPGGKDGIFTFDLGKFDTIYGAEVADSQLNFNYSRGLLYWLAQPAFHTGLRVNAAFSQNFWLTGLLANGWNNSIDNNFGKTLGLQVSAAVPSTGASDGAPPLVDFHLGYLMGPELVDHGLVAGYCKEGKTFQPSASRPDCTTALPATSSNTLTPTSSPNVPIDAGSANSKLRHLVDLVVAAHPNDKLALLLNADLGFERVRAGTVDANPPSPINKHQLWWGVSLAGRYQVSDEWGAALRLEVFGDPDGRATADGDAYVNNVKKLVLGSGTLTIDYAAHKYLLLRLDNRVDFANKDVLPARLRSYESHAITSILGVVAKTN